MKVMLQKCGARRLIMIEHMVCNERQTNCASGAGLAIDTSYSLFIKHFNRCLCNSTIPCRSRLVAWETINGEYYHFTVSLSGQGCLPLAVTPTGLSGGCELVGVS